MHLRPIFALSGMMFSRILVALCPGTYCMATLLGRLQRLLYAIRKPKMSDNCRQEDQGAISKTLFLPLDSW